MQQLLAPDFVLVLLLLLLLLLCFVVVVVVVVVFLSSFFPSDSGTKYTVSCFAVVYSDSVYS